MKKSVLAGLLCLMMVAIVDASPRDRRRTRRAQRRRPQPTRTYQYNYAQPVTTVSSATPATTTPPTAAVADADSVSKSSEVTPGASSDRVTTLKPVVDENSSPAPVPQASSPSPTPVADPLPTVEPVAASNKPFCASCTVLPAGTSPNTALAELNSIRAQRGLHALIEDASLSAIAFKKASIQASRGVMYHPGGTMGGARFEGVGMGPRFTTCYQNATNATYAGAATVVGRNGRRFHCLLLR